MTTTSATLPGRSSLSAFALTLAIGSGLLCTAGCGDKTTTTTATLLSATGQQMGTAMFSQAAGAQQVQVDITLNGLPAGKHGVHVHDIGKCDPPDFTTAGGHFNPTTQAHGDPTQPAHHAGDFGNIDIGASGTGTLSLISTILSLRAGDATNPANHALIIHQGQDDLTTQPTGNSGSRVACGIIAEPSGG